MIRVKVFSSIYKKHYFWYVARCLQTMARARVIYLEIIEGSMYGEHDHAYEVIYIDNHPVYIDLRDDFTLDKPELAGQTDFTLLKANYSSELWDMAERDEYPEGIPYRLRDWELSKRKNIRAFALGRTFVSSVGNELEFANNTISPTYKVVSSTGMGILKTQSINRLKTYELFNKVFGEKAKLMFFDRDHLNSRESIHDLEKYLKKYPNDIPTKFFGDYVKFLLMGEYSINLAGIALSTPFRLVDSVLANRCCISTKIWHDVYKSFPCIELPICGYLGTGDWAAAEKILKNIDMIHYHGLRERAKD